MAKIGNEARLILKLASDRMNTANRRIQADKELDAYYRQGYNAATREYSTELDIIVGDLEAGR